MANYTKVFNNPYPSGWENLPSENTPITAEALQEHTDAISHIEDYLNDNPIKDATDVSWNQIQKSGDEIAEITIDGQKQKVFVPQQKGGASTWSEVAEKPFETIGSGLRVESNVLKSTDLVGTKAEFDAIKDSLPDGSAFDTTDENVGGYSIVAFGAIDTTKVINTLSGQGQSWKATEDCYAYCVVQGGGSGYTANVLVDNVNVMAVVVNQNVSNIIPLKKGQTLLTRSGVGQYNITFFGTINGEIVGGGSAQTIHSNWVASSTTSVNTRLTEKINLNSGKYVAIIRTPYSTSTNKLLISMFGIDNVFSYIDASYGNVVLFFELQNNLETYIQTSQNVSITWDSTYLSRGGVDIIKI